MALREKMLRYICKYYILLCRLDVNSRGHFSQFLRRNNITTLRLSTSYHSMFHEPGNHIGLIR